MLCLHLCKGMLDCQSVSLLLHRATTVANVVIIIIVIIMAADRLKILIAINHTIIAICTRKW